MTETHGLPSARLDYGTVALGPANGATARRRALIYSRPAYVKLLNERTPQSGIPDNEKVSVSERTIAEYRSLPLAVGNVLFVALDGCKPDSHVCSGLDEL